MDITDPNSPIFMIWIFGYAGAAVLKLAELPTPLSMYRARKQAQIEALEGRLRQKERKEIEQAQTIKRLEIDAGIVS